MSHAPWEVWSRGVNMQGAAVNSRHIVEGDNYYFQGLRDRAFGSYQEAGKEGLSPSDREALTYRMAALELTAGKPEDSLLTLSGYFNETQRLVDDVDGRFSILFAYAYARSGDINQALAWFSRANRLGEKISSSAGVRKVLQSVPESRFYRLSETWSHDAFVNTMVGEERNRRSQPGYTGPTQSGLQGNFWEHDQSDHSREQHVGPYDRPSAITSERVGVSVILPLSGRFGALGRSLKNGVELAHEAEGGERIQFNFADSAGDPHIAERHARAPGNSDHSRVIIGPLLATSAEAVSNYVRQTQGIMQLAFSKSSNFVPGQNVFRLGPTAESQVESLLSESSTRLGLTRYAMVYPENSIGQEFAPVFREELAKRGLDLVFEASYRGESGADFLAIAEELERRTDVQAIFMPDNLEMGARLFTSLSPEYRRRVRPLGAANWDNPLRLQHSKTALEGAVFVSPFFLGSEREIISRFVQVYRDRYREAPDFLSAQGFDAATMVIAAINRSLDEGRSVTNSFHLIGGYEGLTGAISVSPNGELLRQFTVVQMRQGEITELPRAETPNFVYHGNRQGPSQSVDHFSAEPLGGM